MRKIHQLKDTQWVYATHMPRQYASFFYWHKDLDHMPLKSRVFAMLEGNVWTRSLDISIYISITKDSFLPKALATYHDNWSANIINIKSPVPYFSKERTNIVVRNIRFRGTTKEKLKSIEDHLNTSALDRIILDVDHEYLKPSYSLKFDDAIKKHFNPDLYAGQRNIEEGKSFSVKIA